MDVGKFLINEECPIIEAMAQMDKTAKKVLFVAEDGVLKAALTDGDIRRWILKNGDLKAPVKNAANYNPLSLPLDRKNEALTLMLQRLISAVPLIDDKGKIVNVLLWEDIEGGKSPEEEEEALDLPVVMMAGGLGTRLYPYTNILPKPLIPVGEIPIAEHIINQFRKLGCHNFHLIVNYKKNMIKAYFNEIEKDYSVSYADEDIPLGTGGGLSLLKGKINETFVLTNCDILIREDFRKIYKLHKDEGNVITMVCSAKDFKIPYGIVEIDSNGSICNLKEKPSLSFLTNTGCYIVEPEVIDSLKPGEKIGFPDVINKYRLAGKKVGIYPVSEEAWLDMGQMDELERMRVRLEQDDKK
ncbi:MAG: NTP transferase domain-containing protein [Lachnospiraceae bacterium]|nr:NTP transferase domain-containing protein [Lachnospiraceae bacterium]